MAMMAPTSVFEMQRLTVKELWNNNIRKPSEIIKMTGFSKFTVYDIINCLKKTGSVEHLPVPSCPLVLIPKKRQYLGRLLKNDNATTSALMTIKLNNLPWSIPLLKESHVEACLKWALNYIQDDWTHTIFSDKRLIEVALFTENMNSAKYYEILQSQLLPNAYHIGYGWNF
ncbi:hypothetical protein C1646_760364 [Rhizophagus diaphanus]|nr:hypothetical protein C1646_760364 [Rhizophagus diaphanus] [Rhizophagus sp. MUCL 43196]